MLPTDGHNKYNGPAIYNVKLKHDPPRNGLIEYDILVGVDASRVNNFPIKHLHWAPVDGSLYFPGSGPIAVVEMTTSEIILWVHKNYTSDLVTTDLVKKIPSAEKIFIRTLAMPL